MTVTDYVGGRSAVRPATEGLSIRKLAFATPGEHALALPDGKRLTVYVLAGTARLDGRPVSADDLMDASGGTLRVAHDAGCELFVIELPIVPSYAPVVRPTSS